MRSTVDSAAIDVGVICGPTAGGKTAIAMWLAEQRPITIVSADSRQVYRGFDIGTAKATSDERARVPHEGIDVVAPTVRYSSAAWSAGADAWIADAIAQGRTPIVVGGTGLYLRALFEGLFAEPPLDVEQRRRLEPQLAALTTPELQRWVERLDPARSHLGRSQLLRAIEIALLTGRRVSDLHAHQRTVTKPRWRPHYLVVDPGPALAQRIGARLDTMLNAGWPNEVERLMHSVPPDAPAWKATGYDSVRRMTRGELTRAAAREAILIETRQYAKRQRTWFRHQLPPPPDPVLTVNPLARDWEELVERWTTGIVYAGQGPRGGGRGKR